MLISMGKAIVNWCCPNPSMPVVLKYEMGIFDTCYPHGGRDDKDSCPHDGRADKDSYPHDRHKQYIMLSL